MAGGQVLVVADGAAVFADPGEGPFDDPAAGQDLEDVPVTLGHDLDGDLHGGGPGGQLAGGVSGIGPDQDDFGAGAVQVPQQGPGAVAVLDGCGGDDHGQEQAAGVYGDGPFTAVDFLGVVPAPAAFGTVSAARTDWESMTAAVGSAFRPAEVLTWARSASCSRVKVPSSR